MTRSTAHFPRILASVAAVLTLFAATLPAQNTQAVVPNRITTPIDNNQLVILHGNTSPFAKAQYDRGPVSAGLPMPDLTLVLSRSPEQQAAFDQYVASEYDSGSPNYHQWLTPMEIGERFGPSESDIAAIDNWLVSQGFTVTRVTPDRMAIRFGGTAGLAESAFHTRIDNLVVHGVPHIGNMTDPSIPVALAPVVVGIKALHNFLPRPTHTAVNKVEFNRQLGGWQRVATATPASSIAASPFHFASPAAAARAAALNSMGPRPLFGINVPASGNNGAYLEEDLSPWDFATIYNVKPLWSDSINGTGQTIAIAGTSDIDLSDVTTFRSIFGLPAGLAPNEIDTNNLATECTSTSSTAVCGIGDLEENTLDVEWSGAVAPDAQIDLVVTGQNTADTVDTVYDSAQYVVEHVTANILNVSYGYCELGNGTAENVAYYDLWQTAAAAGISVFVATGDAGSPFCDDGGDSIGYPYSAQFGLSVSGFASTPYNVAVGGTDFTWCKPTVNSSGNVVGCPTSSTSQGSPAYWNTTNNTTTEPYESAAGYVPEIPWNDTCENPIISNYLISIAPIVFQSTGAATPTNAEGACNFVQNNWTTIYEDYGVMLAPYVDTVGSSGGASNCVVNTDDTDPSNPTCTTGSTTTGTANGSIPLNNDGWQKPYWQSGVAGIPDDGVRDLPDVSFFAGSGALDSAYLLCVSAVGSCSYGDTVENTAEEAGGTSFASPAMAGVMALINQKAGAAQGLPNAQLYQLASQQDYADCSAEGPPQSDCYFHSVDQGTNAMPCDFGATVGGAIYDNGWVAGQTYEGIDSPNCTPLNAGDTVGSLISASVVTSSNPSGVAYNAGEPAGYNMATGLGSLNVANVVNAWTPGSTSTTPGFNLTNSGSITVAPGGTGMSTLTVAPTNGFTGGVNFTCAIGGTPAGLTCAAPSATISGTTSATSTLTATATSTAAAGTYTATVTATDAATGTITATTTVSITVTSTTTGSFTLSNSGNISVTAGSSGTSTINVNPSSGGFTGTVALSCAVTTTSGPGGVTCSLSPQQVTLSGTTALTSTLTVATTSSSAAARFPLRKFLTGAGGVMLAFVVFFGIPARRKSWHTILG
ncbi:MAG: protease pro-enzyme activation domain-containing protein, partial [Acidobacteriaceae bacterium]